jgi:hypothetical protein
VDSEPLPENDHEPVTPEQIAELEADFELNTPKQVTIKAKVVAATLGAVYDATTKEVAIPERPGVVLLIATPNHQCSYVLEREEALQWASQLRRTANSGGGLVIPGEIQ